MSDLAGLVGNVELRSALKTFEGRICEGWFGVILHTVVNFEESKAVSLVEKSIVAAEDEEIGHTLCASQLSLLKVVGVEGRTVERTVNGVAIGNTVVSLHQMESIIAGVAHNLGFESQTVGDISQIAPVCIQIVSQLTLLAHLELTLVVVDVDVAIVDVFLLTLSVHQHEVLRTNLAISGILSNHALSQVTGQFSADSSRVDGNVLVVTFHTIELIVHHSVVLAVVQVIRSGGKLLLLVAHAFGADPVIGILVNGTESGIALGTSSSEEVQVETGGQILQVVNVLVSERKRRTAGRSDSLAVTVSVEISSLAAEDALCLSVVVRETVIVDYVVLGGQLNASVILNYTSLVTKAVSLFAFGAVVESCAFLAVVYFHTRCNDIFQLDCRGGIVHAINSLESWLASSAKYSEFISVDSSSFGGVRSVWQSVDI